MAFLGVEYGTKYVLTNEGGVRAVFNDPTDVDYVGMLSAESSGLDAPEIREDSAERVETDGAIFGTFYSGKRPVVLQGYIAATSLTQRNERVAKLKRASNAKESNAFLTFEPLGAGQQVQVGLRRQQPIRFSSKGPLKEFQLSMVAESSKIRAVIGKNSIAVGIKTGEFVQSPSAVTQEEYNSSEGANGVVWTNPTNAVTSDNVYATVIPGKSINQPGHSNSQSATDYLVGTFSMASLPANARITQFDPRTEAKIEAKVTAPGEGEFPVRPLRIWSKLTPKGSVPLLNAVNTLFEYFNTTELIDDLGFIDPMKYLSVSGSTFMGSRKELTEAMRSETKLALAFEWRFSVAEASVTKVSVDQISLKVRYTVPASVVANNAGDVPADTRILISGPVTNPVVENETTLEKFTYSGTIAKGEEVEFDSKKRTAVSTLFGNVYNKVVFPTNWVKLKPGENTVALSGESASETETRIIVEWFDEWE